MAAFERLVRKHERPLLNFFRRLGVTTDAEDLAQETFVRLFKARTRYRPTAKFTTFLYTIARHVRIDAARKARRTEALRQSVREEVESAAGGDDGGAPGARLDAAAAMERLPEKLRETVVLSVFQGLKYDDIARILRIPVGTVKSRMFLAMERMRAELHEV